MNRIALFLLLMLLLGACGSTDDEVADAGGTSTSAVPGSASGDDASAPLVAAALEELVTNDHTFGDGPPPFTDYLVQSDLDPAAGSGAGDGGDRALTDPERSAIEDAISPFGPVRWIDDADEFRTADNLPTIEGAVILGVGEPVVDGDRALVGVSLWCGGLCGTWLTYEIERIDGIWEVTGIDGPVAIS